MNILTVCENSQTVQQEQHAQSKQSHVIKFRKAENMSEQQVRHLNQHTLPVTAVIKVFSVGGGGTNALNRMIERNIQGVEFIAVNTDVQHLHIISKAQVKLQIGQKITGGRGAGGDPEKGEKAALEDKELIAEYLEGANMVFITAGMGGGTGTGAAPVIAKIAKEMEILTVAIVTLPFEYEGRYKKKLADIGISKLHSEVDSLISIPNQHLFKKANNTTILDDAYIWADEILCNAVQGISELVTETGVQNIDFADVETVMKGKGDAIMGIGTGTGENRAIEAVKQAIDNPILEDTSIDGATGVLVNITCPYGENEITLIEKRNILEHIQKKCDEDAILKFGIIKDPSFENSIKVIIVATGFKRNKNTEEPASEVKKTGVQETISANEFGDIKVQLPKAESGLPPKDYLDTPTYLRCNNYNKGVDYVQQEQAREL